MIRLLCALVLTVFLSQSTLAFAFPCIQDCAGECGGDDSGGRDHEHKRCPCPLNCAPCCAGNAMRTIVPMSLELLLPSPVATELTWLRVNRAPPPFEPAEIAHVPKSGA